MSDPTPPPRGTSVSASDSQIVEWLVTHPLGIPLDNPVSEGVVGAVGSVGGAVASGASTVAVATVKAVAGGIWDGIYAAAITLKNSITDGPNSGGRVGALLFAIIVVVILFA